MQSKGMGELAKNFGGMISKNSPTILTGLSVAGLMSTTILAVRKTPQALILLENERLWRLENNEGREIAPISKRDIIRITWKCYLPATAVGIITIGCIIGANKISFRRSAALASMYTITETAFKEYQTKVVETIGRNKEQKVRDDIAVDRIKKNPSSSNEVIFTGKGEVICYDSLSGRYFKSDIEQIRKTINDINHNLMSSMFITLNELYYALGLPSIKLGDDMGWDIEKGLVEISFTSGLTDEGIPCLVLNYDIVPRYTQ